MNCVYSYNKDSHGKGLHPERRQVASSAEKVKGVTGVILAGGASSRMGSNKALLPQKGVRFIEVIYRTLAELFEEVIVVTNTPEQYAFLPCKKVPDLYPGKGVLAGIHSGLFHSSEPAIFTVACDMPHLNTALIRHLVSLSAGVDIVIPSTEGGMEPLHALYRKGCQPALEELLQESAQVRVVAILSRVQVRKVLPEEIAPFDPEYKSFVNINTPEDYFRLKSCSKERPAPWVDQKAGAVILPWQNEETRRSKKMSNQRSSSAE